MKRSWMWYLVGLLLLGNAAWSQDGSEKAVAALEQKWLDSQKTNNPDLVPRRCPTSSSILEATAKSPARPSRWPVRRPRNMTASTTTI